jgi:hypothetical protein
MDPNPSAAEKDDSLAQEFDSIDAYLQAVHEILQEGHMPDIANLDDRIEHLCSRVRESSPEIQETCLAKLESLVKKLDDCEDEMTAFQESAQK